MPSHPISSLPNHLTQTRFTKMRALIQWFLMTCRLSGSHIAERMTQDLGDAASCVSGTSSSLLPPLTQVSSAWLTCSSLNTLNLSLPHAPPTIGKCLCSLYVQSLPGSVLCLPPSHTHLPNSYLPVKSQLKLITSFVMPFLTPPGEIISSILHGTQYLVFILFLRLYVFILKGMRREGDREG